MSQTQAELYSIGQDETQAEIKEADNAFFKGKSSQARFVIRFI